MSLVLDERSSIASVWVSAVAVLVVGILAAFIIEAEMSRRHPVSRMPAIRAIAILPFQPIVPSKRDPALELGMTETLAARIGTVRSVIVRRRPIDVDAVLEGSVLDAWDKVRVTVRLVRVADRKVMWQGEFDTMFDGIFAVQDAIAARVADELALPLSNSERRQLHKHDTTSPAAYRAYLLGRYRRRAEFFQRAIHLDPHYAQAYAALAELSQSKETARKAIALDPENSDAYIVLGDFRRALEVSPNSAHAHMGYARLLASAGRRNEAARERAEALRLDPTLSE